MSTYGLRVKDSVGNVILDVDGRLNKHRYSNEVAAGASGNTTLSDISGLLTIELSVMINPPIIPWWNYAPHIVSRDGTTINWTPPSGIISNDSLILVFFYV